MKKRIQKLFRLSFWEDILVYLLRPFVLLFTHPGYLFRQIIVQTCHGMSLLRRLSSRLRRLPRWCWATKPRRLVSSLLIILFLLYPLHLLFFTRSVDASWWNDQWYYRKPVTVTNSSGGTLLDFQVSFTIDTTDTTKFQSSCADIRVTDRYGDVLPHWIEENNPGCGNASTRIWVKVPSLAAGTSTLYVYYGNSIAQSTSDGTKVFDFFDGFNAGSLDTDKWTATGSQSFSGGKITITTGDINTNEPILSTPQNYTYEMKARFLEKRYQC